MLVWEAGSMSSLLEKIRADLVIALKAKNTSTVECLRFLLGAIKNFEIAKYASVEGNLTDEDILLVLGKQVKTHKESIEMFSKAKREDLVGKETRELEVLLSYMPKQMSEEEILMQLKQLKESNNLNDFNSLIKIAVLEFKGKADSSLVAKLVRQVV